MHAESQEREEIATGSQTKKKSDGKPSGNRAFPTAADIPAMLLIFFLAQGVSAAILSAFGLTVPDLPVPGSTNIEDFMQVQILRGERIAILYPVSMLVSLLSVYLYVLLRGGKRRIAHFSPSGFNPNIILSGIVWIVSAQIVLEPAMSLLPSIENAGVGRGFWACITAMVFAPVLEETLCRGIVLETLRHRWGNAVAVLVSAMFFGIVHIDPATALTGFVVGTVLGMIYLRTSSLFSTIILHSINNAIALALIWLDMDNIALRDIISNDLAYYSVYTVACTLFLIFFLETARKVFRRQ